MKKIILLLTVILSTNLTGASAQTWQLVGALHVLARTVRKKFT